MDKKDLQYKQLKANYDQSKAAFKQAQEKAETLLGKNIDPSSLSQLLNEYQQYTDAYQKSFKKMQQDRERMENAVNDSNGQLKTLSAKVEKLTVDKKALQSKIDTVSEHDFKGDLDNLPLGTYWQQPNANLQKTSPWLSPRIQSIRTELFWSSVRLHKYFIVLARKPLCSNITALMRLLKGELPSEHHTNVRSLWASLFLTVPVVSTTFASMQRLFRHLKQEEIGWLMVDEAGQTPPHYPVGAIWRAKTSYCCWRSSPN